MHCRCHCGKMKSSSRSSVNAAAAAYVTLLYRTRSDMATHGLRNKRIYKCYKYLAVELDVSTNFGFY